MNFEGKWVRKLPAASPRQPVTKVEPQNSLELVSFEARADGEAAVLTWQTASEVNNAGFEVQQRVHGTGKPYETTGYVAGHGTTLAAHTYTYRVADVMPGYHQFRLKQIDYDGSVAYSPEARLAVTLDEGYKLEDPYPNPFNPRAVARFAVQRAQPVHADLYDVLGRRVQELYSGTPAPNQAYTLYVDGTPLAGGCTLSP